MIKWIKNKIDDFVYWITDDMNAFFVILVLIGFIFIGILFYLVATGKEVNMPAIIYLPRVR